MNFVWSFENSLFCFYFPARIKGFQHRAGVCSKGHCGDQRLIIACVSSGSHALCGMT